MHSSPAGRPVGAHLCAPPGVRWYTLIAAGGLFVRISGAGPESCASTGAASAPAPVWTGWMSIRRSAAEGAPGLGCRTTITKSSVSNDWSYRETKPMYMKSAELCFTPWNTAIGTPEAPPKAKRAPCVYPASSCVVVIPGSGSTKPSTVGGSDIQGSPSWGGKGIWL